LQRFFQRCVAFRQRFPGRWVSLAGDDSGLPVHRIRPLWQFGDASVIAGQLKNSLCVAPGTLGVQTPTFLPLSIWCAHSLIGAPGVPASEMGLRKTCHFPAAYCIMLGQTVPVSGNSASSVSHTSD